MKQWKNIWIGMVLLSISNFLSAQSNSDTVSIDLQQAWQRADGFSKEVLLKQMDAQISAAHVQDAKRNWVPKVEAEAMYGMLSNIPVFVDGLLKDPEFIPIEDHSAYELGVQASLNLYDGHKVKIAVDKAKTKEAMQQHITEATTSEVHYDVAQYYLQILGAKAYKKIITQNITENKKRLKQITQLYDNGVVLKSDLLRAQLQLSQQETNLLKMENNIDIDMQKLNMLLGFDDDCILNLTDSIPIQISDSESSYAAYVQQSMEESPFEKMAETQLSLSALEQQAIKAERLPKISLFGEYSYSYPQIMLYPYETAPYLLGVGGIRLSYNISSLYSNKYKESAASLELQKQRIARENTEEILRSSIKTAYKRYKEDKANIEVTKLNIAQAEENYRIVHQTYFNKLALITDLLEADNQLLQAKLDLVNNYISARLHYYQILKITGQL